MKLFQTDRTSFFKYLEEGVKNDNLELELIFGFNPSKNPINKTKFVEILNKCKISYSDQSEITDLDIRIEYKNNSISSIRSTIHGLDSIKKYCKTDSLEGIDNIDFIEKKNNRSFPTLRDEHYNTRFNLKTENSLKKSHHFVRSYLSDFEEKRKHFRYKKRYSFITEDKLFRIDLTVVKSTKYIRNKGHDLQKTFKQANILNNREEYELEIEYIGWNKDTGIKAIDNLYNSLDEQLILNDPGKVAIGNTYDPLNIGIPVKSYDITTSVEDFEYPSDVSPRNDHDNPKVLMKYTDSSTRYSQEDYRELIGKFTKIKRKYFEENDIDERVADTIDEYHRRGINIAIINNIYEEIDEETGDYSDTKVEVSLYPGISGITKLNVPIKYLYGGYFSIEDKIIKSKYKLEDDQVGDFKLKLELDQEYDQGPTYSPGSPLSGGGSYETMNGGANKIQEVRDDLTNALSNILEKNVIFLTKIIQNTDEIISYRLKEEIIEKYKKVTGQRAGYFKLIGPQPKTLNMELINVDNPDSIIIDYAVTEKADGERYQLFIHNNQGYLINNKMNLIKTGTYFKWVSGDWILDGEYITKDKFNSPIKKFMVFDVYWCGLKNLQSAPAHTFPFVSRDPSWDDASRSEILKKFKSLINRTDVFEVEGTGESVNIESVISEVDNPIEVDVKNYEYGYTSISEEDKINPSKLSKDDINKIFKSSKNILQMEKDGKFQYRIDGLIFLPIRLSVNGSVEGFQSKKIDGTWPLNYKWKPEHENTIDFQINIKKELIRGKLVESEFPYVKYDNYGQKQISKYKQVELIVGYDEKKDRTIDYCMKILKDENSENNKQTTQLFNINSDEDEKYNIINIPLTDGKLLCDNFDKDEIKDGDILEMRFNREATNSMYWEPIRVRSDKIRPQFFEIANDVWGTIINPVTEKHITGGKISKDKIDPEITGKYYVNNENNLLTESNKLRKLHNYIKSKLISGVLSTSKSKMKVLDLSCGRGGDINKYINNVKTNVSLLVGIDISSNIHEACLRFYDDKDKCKGVFIRGDTSKNILDGNVADVDGGDKKDKKHTETMLSILYNKKSKIPEEYKVIKDRYLGLASNGFDIISSQFSMHYYFKNSKTFNGFITNLVENTTKGGYFIGTCYDGNKIFDFFEKRKETMDKYKAIENEGISSSEEDTTDEEEDTTDEEGVYDVKNDPNRYQYKDVVGNIVFSVEKKYVIEDFDYNDEDTSNIFGNEIDVYMDSIGQSITEYLVNFEYFINIMKKNGFELTVPPVKGNHTIFRKDYFDNGLGRFENVINKLEEINQSDNEFRKYYKEAIKMSPGDYTVNPLSTLSSFNNYFIFKKVN